MEFTPAILLPQTSLKLPAGSAEHQILDASPGNSGTLLLPGIPAEFIWKALEPVPEIAEVFAENDCSAETVESLKNHQALLLFSAGPNPAEHIEYWNHMILTLMQNGAQGVYIEYCDRSFTAQQWEDIFSPGSEDQSSEVTQENSLFSLEPWIRVLKNQNVHGTLGMQAFNRADLVIQAADNDEENIMALLYQTAEQSLEDPKNIKPGKDFHWEEQEQKVSIALSTQGLFHKKHELHNPHGYWKLTRF